MHLREIVFCSRWVECFIDVYQVMLFKSSISLLIFSLVILSIIENVILMSPAIIVEFSISPFKSVSFCFLYFGTHLDANVFIIITPSWWTNPFIIIKYTSLSLTHFVLKFPVYFIWYHLPNYVTLYGRRNFVDVINSALKWGRSSRRTDLITRALSTWIQRSENKEVKETQSTSGIQCWL